MNPQATQIPLAFSDPSPHRHVRRGDSGGSAVAAIELVESGTLDKQILYVIGLVAMMPGRTSAELAEASKEKGEKFGFDLAGWRSVLARRLPDAEGRGSGPIVGSERRFYPSKPWRRLDPTQGREIRWWPKGVSN